MNKADLEVWNKLLAWLDERIAWYTHWCLEDADKRGYPGKIRYAGQDMRYALEAFKEVKNYLQNEVEMEGVTE
jgi:hypothetical protein